LEGAIVVVSGINFSGILFLIILFLLFLVILVRVVGFAIKKSGIDNKLDTINAKLDLIIQKEEQKEI